MQDWLNIARSWIRRHMGRWSPIHFVFDTCLTGVFITVFGWLTKMPWHLQIVLGLFVLGTIASGMSILLRRSDALQTKDRPSPWPAPPENVKEEIQSYLADSEEIRTVEQTDAWLVSVASGIEGLLGDGEREKFWTALPDGRLAFETRLVGGRNYLRGLAARIPKHVQF